MERWVELRHIRYVAAAAEHGSFRRAAESMGVRVSTLSRGIGDLEDKIGAALFMRRPQGVTPTFAGEHFLVHAQQVLRGISTALREAGVAGTGREGSIRIGFLSSLGSGFLATLTRLYQAVFTEVRVVYIEGGIIDHVTALRRHHLDIAFLPHPMAIEDCESLDLWNEQLFAAMPEDDELSSHTEVGWQDLQERRFIFTEMPPGPDIRSGLEKRFPELGFRPWIELLAVYRDTLMQVVAGGGGITLVGAARVVEPFRGVACRPITGEFLIFHAVWLPTNGNPAFRRFLSLAKVLSKRCPFCGFGDGLNGVSDSGDGGEAEDVSPVPELYERLIKIVSRRCALCLLRNIVFD